MNIAFIGDQEGKVHHARYKVFQDLIPSHFFSFFTVDHHKLTRAVRKFDAVYYASLGSFMSKPIEHGCLMASATSWKCYVNAPRIKLTDALSRLFRVSANNKGLADALRPYREDIAEIPNGVDSGFFSPLSKTVNLSVPIIGWVGNIDRAEKNYALFDQVSRSLSDYAKFVSIISCKASQVEDLRDRHEMLSFYHSLHFHLVTSLFEGTPNPALEAAACGVPLITTKVGNMPEIIEDGENGYFVEPTFDSIAERILSVSKMSDDKYRGMSESIRAKMETDWTWEKSCKLFDAFFTI